MIDTPESRDAHLRAALDSFGQASFNTRWTEDDPDYVAALELTSDDVPTLLAVIRDSLEPVEDEAAAGDAGNPEEPDEPDAPDALDEAEDPEEPEGPPPKVYAPVHAWRALGQLHASEAIDELIELADPLFALQDDWFLEDFSRVCGLLGPDCFARFETALADTDLKDVVRVALTEGIQDVAERHPEHRDRAVAILTGQLDRYTENTRVLNGFLTVSLLDLRAAESADAIERAHADDHVDLSICGNWNEVRHRPGVEGQGLVPASLADWKWHHIDEMYRKPGSWKTPPTPNSPRVQKRRQRFDRKRERKNRRRGQR